MPPPPPTFGLILPAAGSASRFGIGEDKLLLDIAGQSVLTRSVALFAHRPNVSHIVIVTAPDRIEPYRQHLAPFALTSRFSFIPGGRERWESVLFGLRHLAALPAPPTYVAIHDAARPLTPAVVIDQAFQTTLEQGAALPCVAEPATLKKAAPDHTVALTLDRRGLYQAQTPQCFTLATLLAGYEKLLAANQLHDVTDDAQIIERTAGEGAAGRATQKIPITLGDPLNLKITTKSDLTLARAIAANLP